MSISARKAAACLAVSAQLFGCASQGIHRSRHAAHIIRYGDPERREMETAILGPADGEPVKPNEKSPLRKARASVLSGERSIVMLRLAAKAGGGDFGRPSPLALEIFRLTAIGARKEYHYTGRGTAAPSPMSKKEGWRFMLLPPGMYRLEIAVNEAAGVKWNAVADGHPAPAFALRVPRGKPVVYAGSLQIPCEREKPDGPGWRCSAEPKAADETEGAREIAGKAFPRLGDVSTSLMRRYGAPLGAGRLKELAPISLAAESLGSSIASPAPVDRAAESAGRPRSSGLGGGGFRPVGGGGGGPGIGLLILLIVAVALTVVVIHKVNREWMKAADAEDNEKIGRMAKHLNGEMRKAAGERPLPERLRERLAGRLAARGIGEPENPPAPGSAHALKTTLTSFALMPCKERMSFSIMMEMEVELYRSDTKETLSLTHFRYDNPENPTPSASSILMKPHAACHGADAWMGEKGGKLLRRELDKGLDALAEHLLPKAKARQSAHGTAVRRFTAAGSAMWRERPF